MLRPVLRAHIIKHCANFNETITLYYNHTLQRKESIFDQKETGRLKYKVLK